MMVYLIDILFLSDDKFDNESRSSVLNLIILTGLIVFGVVQITQAILTFRFFVSTRKIGEVGRLPKVMIILGNVIGVVQIVFWCIFYIYNEPWSQFTLMICKYVMMFVIMALWMRFLRV